MTRSLLFPAAVLVLFASCTQESTSPLAQVAGPQAVDPDVTQPGVYLGFSVYDCLSSAGATGLDADQDGLIDLCEQPLADAFAPELQYNPDFDMRREPRWAARATAANEVYGAYKVVIAYLLSYYEDGGDAYEHQGGHYGDSETIGLTVYYDIPTQHWVLEDASYSAHLEYGHFSRGGAKYPLVLEYPEHAGTYPRAWVSSSKHANYRSEAGCNNSNWFGSDTCVDAVRTARVETYLLDGTSGNIGSYSVPFADCVESLNPSYLYGRDNSLECYWTYRRFRGWVLPSYYGGDSDPQVWRLDHFGFIPPPPPDPPDHPPECGHWEVRPVYDGEGQETGSYENVWVPEDC